MSSVLSQDAAGGSRSGGAEANTALISDDGNRVATARPSAPDRTAPAASSPGRSEKDGRLGVFALPDGAIYYDTKGDGSWVWFGKKIDRTVKLEREDGPDGNPTGLNATLYDNVKGGKKSDTLKVKDDGTVSSSHGFFQNAAGIFLFSPNKLDQIAAGKPVRSATSVNDADGNIYPVEVTSTLVEKPGPDWKGAVVKTIGENDNVKLENLATLGADGLPLTSKSDITYKGLGPDSSVSAVSTRRGM